MLSTDEKNGPRENLSCSLAAFNNKDLDKLSSLYDPESLYANATAPLAQGIEQIAPWYEQAFAGVDGTLLFKEEALFQENTMALLVGKYFFRPPNDKEPSDHGDTGRVALIYRRAADGRWLLLFDMDNTPPDVSPQDFD